MDVVVQQQGWISVKTHQFVETGKTQPGIYMTFIHLFQHLALFVRPVYTVMTVSFINV